MESCSKTRWWSAGPAALVCLFSSTGGLAQDRPPIQVVVAPVEARPLAASRWVPATVIARHRARIAAEQPGRLLEVAEVGQRLTAQSTLFRIDDFELRQERAVALADSAREQARIRYLDKETGRLRSLARTNNAAQTQLEKTASDRDVARADLAAAQARLRQIDERLRRLAPAPPYPSVVLERLKQAGEWVAAGDEVVAIANDRDLEIEATASVTTMPFVRIGQDLPIERRGRSAYQPAGAARVRAIVTAADTTTHRFTLRLEPPRDGDWTIGQALRVAIPASTGQAVLSVPRDALVLRPQGAAVFRVGKDGKAERIPVETGIAAGPYIEVRGALAAGDRVIVRGGERLRPGQRVHVSGTAGAS